MPTASYQHLLTFIYSVKKPGSQNSTNCTATSYRLDKPGLNCWPSIKISSSLNFQTSSVTHPTFYSAGSGGTFPQRKVARTCTLPFSSTCMPSWYVQGQLYILLWKAVDYHWFLCYNFMFSGVKGVNIQVLLKYEWATGKAEETWVEGNRRIPDVVYVTGCTESATTYNIVQDTISLLDIKNEIMNLQWEPISHFLPHKLMQLQGTHSMVDWNSYEVSLHKRLRYCEIWGSHGSAAEVSVFWSNTVLLG